MSPEDAGTDVMRAVAEALELPREHRAGRLADRLTDPLARRDAEQLLRACEHAAASPVLDGSAIQLAAPLLAEAEERDRGDSAALGTALAGRYTVERELGRGGQATVYLARDERHGRLVALKVLHAGVLYGGGEVRATARFQREIGIAARLAHPHILPLYDSGAAAGRLFYITPYVDGETLRDHLVATGKLPVESALRILRDVARALSYAHRHGVVHRDIKPANILLTRDGDALVSDFGIAKALAAVTEEPTHESEDITDGILVIGTPAYMAPEQAVGNPTIDHRADLYALGVVAHELLAGSTPFAGRARHEMLAAHLSERPAGLSAGHPEIPAELAALVDDLLAKRPDDRPRDAEQVLEVLNAALSGALSSPFEGPPAAPKVEVQQWGTSNSEAYELYRKGRYLVGAREHGALLGALRYFDRAVELDPAYARAYAGTADAYTMLAVFGHLRPHEAHPSARAAAEHAIALDEMLPEAHAMLAHQMVVYDWNWAAAGPAFERAIDLDPAYPETRMYYASYLHSIGRHQDALAQLAEAQTLDPLKPTAVLSGRVYVDTHRADEAIRVLEEQVALDPRRDLAHELLAHAYLQKGLDGEAVASMQRAAASSGPRDSAQLAYIYAATGDAAEARRVLARVLMDETRVEPLGFHIGMAYAGLGETDDAFRWLEAGYRERGGFMNLLAVSSGFDAVRSDPRFADLLRRMGLAGFAVSR
ncbi:MAG: protein kinase [Gemmatimonadales bacterium]